MNFEGEAEASDGGGMCKTPNCPCNGVLLEDLERALVANINALFGCTTKKYDCTTNNCECKEIHFFDFEGVVNRTRDPNGPEVTTSGLFWCRHCAAIFWAYYRVKKSMTTAGRDANMPCFAEQKGTSNDEAKEAAVEWLSRYDKMVATGFALQTGMRVDDQVTGTRKAYDGHLKNLFALQKHAKTLREDINKNMCKCKDCAQKRTDEKVDNTINRTCKGCSQLTEKSGFTMNQLRKPQLTRRCKLCVDASKRTKQ